MDKYTPSNGHFSQEKEYRCRNVVADSLEKQAQIK